MHPKRSSVILSKLFQCLSVTSEKIDPTSILPKEILLMIVQYLPFKERIRIGRVNTKFQLISKLTVSEINYLDLYEPALDPVPLAQLSNLIYLCSINLQKVNLQSDNLTDKFNGILEAFSRVACPRLLYLNVASKIDEIDNVDFIIRNLIRNNPNLKGLNWETNSNFIFPADMISEKLETLQLRDCDDFTLMSLTGRCPNLKSFSAAFTGYVSPKVLDEFFFSCPHLRALDFLSFGVRYFVDLETLDNFRRLMLRELRVGWLVTDNFLLKIGESFPRLEILELGNLNVNNRGVAALASLKNLRQVIMHRNRSGNDIDEGVQRLGDCRHLEYARLNCNITSTTMIAMVRFCPELRLLEVIDVTDIYSAEMAENVMRSFGQGPKRLTIRFDKWKSTAIWNSAQVHANAVLEDKDKNGSVIKFESRCDEFGCPRNV